jgi:trimethylamine:corrinoid methyltransferase-like protein
MEGAMSMGQRAKKKVRHILDNYRPQPLPAEVDAEIDKILGKIKGGGNE